MRVRWPSAAPLKQMTSKPAGLRGAKACQASKSFVQTVLRNTIWTVALNRVIIYISSTLTVGETNAVSVVVGIKIHIAHRVREPDHQWDAMEASLAKGEKLKAKAA